MKLEVWGQTDVGLKRSNNQDSFLVDKALNLFIVADGMGGHSGGEIASAMAVESVQEVVSKECARGGKLYPREIITRAFQEANDRIYQRSNEENSALKGMGTTMVVSFFYNNIIYVGNVGDSRCYLFSAPHLWQITEDHSLINEHLRAGLIQESDIPHFVAKNIITRSVGFEPGVQADLLERKLNPGESLLMCSDGLSGLVTDQRLADLFLTVPLPELVSRCIFEAKRNGGGDNITAVVIHAVPEES